MMGDIDRGRANKYHGSTCSRRIYDSADYMEKSTMRNPIQPRRI
jgi:hypothetical protein